jgi:transcriptional regulator with XRE-family HTH domain
MYTYQLRGVFMREAKLGEPSGLGRFVRERRQAAGLSQRQLALAASVSVSNISRLESGFHLTPSLELLRRVAEVLDIDMAELLSYRGIPMPDGSAGLRVYLRRQYGLPDQGVAEAEAAIERIATRYRRSKEEAPERRTG